MNGIESKFDNLCNFLSGLSHKVDILSITESSEQDGTGFLSNIDIDGYVKFHTPSNSSRGGTLVYVNDRFNVIERNDLTIQSDQFEGTWIEVKNSKSKTFRLREVNNFIRRQSEC